MGQTIGSSVAVRLFVPDFSFELVQRAWDHPPFVIEEL